MANGYIDSYGSHIPEYDTILEDLKQDIKNIFGEDLYLEDDSKDLQMLAVFALYIYNTYLYGESVYNSFSPSTAQGIALSNRVAINGIKRKNSSKSQVEVKIEGTAGTIINNGVVEDTNGVKWDLPSQVIIPVSSVLYATATCQEVGEIGVMPHQITKINTLIRGWNSVDNEQSAILGRDIETDAELRQRQRISTNIPSKSILSGLAGTIANIKNVIKYKLYENDSEITDSNGIPPHHISVVVAGGDSNEIGNNILLKKSLGCGTYGTTSIDITDEFGVVNTINFFRPTEVSIKINLTIKALHGYINIVEPVIKENLVNYINNLEIGTVIYQNRLETITNRSDRDGLITFDIVSLELSKNDSSFTANNVILNFSENATIKEEDIEITVQDIN